MKWRALWVVALSATACARDASLPGIALRDGSVADEPEASDEPPEDDAAAETPNPEPAKDGGDAGEPVTPGEDAGGSPCTGPVPPRSVDVGDATFTSVSVNGAGNRVSVAAGESLAVSFDYAPTCGLTTIPTVSPRIGFAEGPTACAETGALCVPIISVTAGASGAPLTLTAPSEPGEYGIYGALEHGTTFSGGVCDPYPRAPAESARIATICVD